MKKKRRDFGMVYSTNPDYEYSQEEEQESIPPNQQELKVYLDRKNRGGKTATIVRGYQGPDDEILELGKQLKAACGVGGSVKEGEIIIQGEKRDRVMEILKNKGFKVKRVGG